MCVPHIHYCVTTNLTVFRPIKQNGCYAYISKLVYSWKNGLLNIHKVYQSLLLLIIKQSFFPPQFKGLQIKKYEAYL
jgi:hypothetical protein